MKPPQDGWDEQERDALDDLGATLDALRARHAGDPPVDLLRAARHDALPGVLQLAAADRLAADPWSRALTDSLSEALPAVDRVREDRVLAQIRAAVAAPAASRSWWASWRDSSWRVWATATAAALLVAAVWLARPHVRTPDEPPAPSPASPTAPAASPAPATAPGRAASAAPTIDLPLDAPVVTLSLAAVTWRAEGRQNPLLADLKAPLDAFRAADYARADPAFSRLEATYPRAVEVFFYGGVARLFIGDPARASVSLARAADLADESFAADVAWYRAIAEHRAGRTPAARPLLEDVCRSDNTHARQACVAVRQIDAAAGRPGR